MASGVLLSAGLVHQLADSANTLNQPDEFPWAMFFCGLAFLSFMVLEESLHLLAGEHNHHHSEKSYVLNAATLQKMMHGYHDKKLDHLTDVSNDDVIDEDRPLLDKPTNRNERDTSSGSNIRKSCAVLRIDDTSQQSGTRERKAANKSIHSHHHPPSDGLPLSTTTDHVDDPYPRLEHHHHEDHIDLHLHGSILASGILMLALSIHSILAGISIGIEQDLDSLAGTAIAILAHKSFEGFCLGSSMANANIEFHSFMVLGVAFSFATPLGILFGQFVVPEFLPEDAGSSRTSSIAVVQAVVAGTFLYIAIVEIGTKESLACRQELSGSDGSSNDDKTRMKLGNTHLEVAKLLCFVFGFLAMSGLAAFV